MRRNFLILSATVLALIIVNLFISRSIREKIAEIPQETAIALSPVQDLPQRNTTRNSSPENMAFTGELVRKTRVERGSDLTESIFYWNGKEIARQIISKEGKIEQTGEIPNGKVKFYDEYNKTHGEEFYENGRKNGRSKTYYGNGHLKSEATYVNGKLRIAKEYYANGQLRFSGDYRDARDLKDSKETGIGKLYNRDGSLKYEWHMTNAQKIGFKKSYNRDGGLRAASYYNGQSLPLEKAP